MAIDVTRHGHQLFHTALEGSSPDNDRWVERKARVVDRFGHSSLYVRLLCEQDGTTLRRSSSSARASTPPTAARSRC